MYLNKTTFDNKQDNIKKQWPVPNHANDHISHAKSASRIICQAIRQTDATIRQEYPLLNQQDFIGGAVFVSSLLFMVFFSYLYVSNSIGVVIAILLIAIPISLLHELEHDIIHNLYFKQYRWIQNIMFVFIYFAKLHISPWYRRQFHLKHHLLSGQINDAEERFIGLGLPPNYKRMAVSLHPFGGFLISDDITKDAKYIDLADVPFMNILMFYTFFFITKIFIAYNLLFLTYSWLDYDSNTIYGVSTLYPIIHYLAICLCFPNLVRQSCLVLMSSSCHYYGDIPLNTVYYQNQILDSWFVFPFQLFCFNFGATHILHHYVVSQPFYIRHFTARLVKDTMIKLGVRNNDFGILWRNNRYTIDTNEDEKQKLYGKSWFAACLFIGFPLCVVWDMMVMYKSSQKIPEIIRKKLAKENNNSKQINNNIDDQLEAKKKTDENFPVGTADEVNKLDALVNKIAFYDVSADQIEYLSKAAIDA